MCHRQPSAVKRVNTIFVYRERQLVQTALLWLFNLPRPRDPLDNLSSKKRLGWCANNSFKIPKSTNKPRKGGRRKMRSSRSTGPHRLKILRPCNRSGYPIENAKPKLTLKYVQQQCAKLTMDDDQTTIVTLHPTFNKILTLDNPNFQIPKRMSLFKKIFRKGLRRGWKKVFLRYLKRKFVRGAILRAFTGL